MASVVPDPDALAVSPQAMLAHAEWVQRLARALLRNDDTDDVVQQTWAQALGSSPPSRNLRGWLGAIARNIVRRSVRDEATRARHELRAPPPGGAPDPAQAVARAELHRRVVDAVLALEEPYRSTLVLRFFEERPADAIARAAGVPVETVRTRVKRGLAQLRERLGGEFASEGSSLEEGLAMLLIPATAGAGAGAGGTGAATSAASSATTVAGSGAVAMGTGTKLLVTLAAAIVVVVAAWRLTAPHDEADARDVAVNRPAAVNLAPAPALAPPAVAAATRAPDELPSSEPVAAATEEDDAAKSFDVTGRVVDERGAPVADAFVLLGNAELNWARPWVDHNDPISSYAEGLFSGRTKPETIGARLVRSGADGGFKFEQVDGDHAYELAALHELAGVGRAHAPARATKEPVVVRLAPMIVVRGTIREVDGRVPAGAGVAIDEIYNAVESMGGDARPVREDGTFRCFWTKIQSATFTARAADGRESETMRLDFGPADPRVRDVALVLPASGGGPCRGRLVDAHGAPFDLRRDLLPRLTDWERAEGAAAGLRIYGCSGDAPPAERFEIGTAIERGTLDLDHATWEVVLSAKVRFVALVARDRTLAAAAVTRANAGDHGPDLVVDLARLPAVPTRAAIEVHLFDGAPDKPYAGPVAEARIDAMVLDPEHPGVGYSLNLPPHRSDEKSGTIWFDGMKASHCTMMIEVEGRMPVRRSLDVVARAEPYRVDIVLARAAATMRGQVVDSDGRPLERAHVRLLWRGEMGFDATNNPPTLTNADGRFIFEHLAGGDALLLVHALPFAPAVVPVKLAADADAGAIALTTGGRVVVTVARSRSPSQSSWSDVHAFRTADSVPLAAADWEGSIDWKTATRLEIPLPTGRATIDVTLIDGTKLHQEVDVAAGKAQELKIE